MPRRARTRGSAPGPGKGDVWARGRGAAPLSDAPVPCDPRSGWKLGWTSGLPPPRLGPVTWALGQGHRAPTN